MAQKKTDEGREIADMVSMYGVGVLYVPFERYVALYQQLERQREAWSAIFARGMRYGQTRGMLPLRYFDALEVEPGKVMESKFRSDMSRQRAK